MTLTSWTLRKTTLMWSTSLTRYFRTISWCCGGRIRLSWMVLRYEPSPVRGLSVQDPGSRTELGLFGNEAHQFIITLPGVSSSSSLMLTISNIPPRLTFK